MFLCPSVRKEQLGSYQKDFHEILFEYFRKYVEKIQIWLKTDNNNGCFT
jgi:gamma-glutamylcysteine synthetase